MTEINVFLIGIGLGFAIGFLVAIFMFSILSVNTIEEEKNKKSHTKYKNSDRKETKNRD